MRIHFVCTGNAFRSRLAEAYLNSKNLPNLKASSSGVKPAPDKNGVISWYAQRILQYGLLLPYTGNSWKQTTNKILEKADLIIIFGKKNYQWCKKNLDFGSKKYQIWEILDLSDLGFTSKNRNLTDDLKRIKATEKIFYQIKEKVDQLIKANS